MRRHARRLLPPPPASVIYGRSADLQRKADQLALERHNRRMHRLAVDFARKIEEIADEHHRPGQRDDAA